MKLSMKPELPEGVTKRKARRDVRKERKERRERKEKERVGGADLVKKEKERREGVVSMGVGGTFGTRNMVTSVEGLSKNYILQNIYNRY